MFRLRKIELLLMLPLLISCQRDQEIPKFDGYPTEVGKILVTKCAVSGCHNEISKQAAGGLSLASWSTLLEGGANKNPAVVPFWVDQSTIFLFSNQYEDLGLSVPPLMPFGREPLSREEVEVLHDWILNGAPNNQGQLPFHDHATRSKYYVLNDGCDLVSVFDLETGLLMRYIDIGTGYNKPVETIRCTPDGNSWFTLGHNGLLKKFSCSSDEQVGSIQLTDGFWRNMEIAPDGRTAALTNWVGNTGYGGGSVALIDLPTMTLIKEFNNPVDSIYFPQGIAFHPSDSVLLVSANTSNFYYRIDFTNLVVPQVSRHLVNPVDNEQFTGSAYRPSVITFTPSGSQYVMLCEKSNEVRRYDANTDTLVSVTGVGGFPADIVFSTTSNKAVVSCMEDLSQGKKGLLYVIDLSNWQVSATVNPGYQPKGLAYDVATNEVIVVNRNADPTGADAPHHYTGCEGNNGYVTRYNLSSQQLNSDYKVEVSVDPYDVALRIK